MKIAVIRAASVNDWELQSYLPLSKKYQMTIFGAWFNEYAFTLPLNIVKLPCLANFLSFLPGGINFLYKKYGDPQMLLGLERALSGFDIAHTVERTNYYSLQAVRAKKMGLVKKIIVHCWENLLHFKENSLVQREMKREIDTFADLFVAGTYGARDVLLNEGIPKRKISVIPFGINTDHFIYPKRKYKKDITVLFAARMTRAKGVYVLFEAAKDIIKNGKIKDISFVFMGEGEEKVLLKSLIKREKLERWVQVADFVPYAKLREMYWRSEMLVLPSTGTSTWIEQFGLVLTEAMASGTAVIGSRLGSIAEIIGDCGLLFASGNSSELAEAILKMHCESKLRHTLSQKARQRVITRFSSAVVSHKLDRVYQTI